MNSQQYADFKLMVVEYSDYDSYPLGGQTTLIRNFVANSRFDLALVGLRDDSEAIGK